jgi:hypothetical protein
MFEKSECVFVPRKQNAGQNRKPNTGKNSLECTVKFKIWKEA